MSTHIYQAPEQPLVGHKMTINTPSGTRTWKSKTKPLTLAFCGKCGQRRRAKNMNIRCYYDTSYIYCADGCRKESK